ncbi:SSURE domain-containing protein [Mesoplasma tabanidae]|uniref:Uncharacterized protein n=1 Tax=Mesoplasma tabanidae TaxID=219745 RepID=A0A2K8P4F8_9MOLU|nr:fibronectin-binding SSURE repeat-containing protein [Mesoplasma tabanidae]ATZ21627.1 hypothetical protein MTABA_v1c04280 [Mesoplasma tabanidae]
MKKLLSILGIGIFVTGTSTASYPILSSISQNFRINENIKILKVSEIKQNLQEQLNNTFKNEEDVVKLIKTNNIKGIEYSAQMRPINDGLHFGLRTFNIIVKITDFSLYQWENSDKPDMLLTMTAFIDERIEISTNLIQQELNKRYENKIFDSEIKAQREILLNNEIITGANVIYVEPTNAIKPEDSKIYQQKYNVKVSLDDKYKWDIQQQSTEGLYIKTNIDERNKIDSESIKNEIKEKLNLNNKHYETISEATNELKNVDFTLKNDVEIINVKPLSNITKIDTKQISLSYDLKLKEPKKNKWVDETVDDINAEVSVAIDSRNEVDLNKVNSEINTYIQAKQFKSVEEALNYTKEYKNLPEEIIFDSVTSTSTTIFGNADLTIKLKIKDSNKAKWSDNTTETKTITIQAKIDGRSIVDLNKVNSEINTYIQAKQFKSVEEALNYTKEYKNLPEEIIFDSVTSTSTTIFGNADLTIKLKIKDSNKAKWSDNTTETKTITIQAKIDGRSIVDLNKVNSEINTYIQAKQFKSVEEALNYTKEYKNLPEEIIFDSVTSTSTTIFGNADLTIKLKIKDSNKAKWSDNTTETKTITIQAKIDGRISIKTDLIVTDLGYFAWKETEAQQTIKNKILEKNANLKIDEIELTEITNKSAKVNVNQNSSIYFVESLIISFERDVRVALATHVNKTNIGQIQTTRDKINLNLLKALVINNPNLNTNEIEILNINYSDENNCKFDLSVKKDSKVYFETKMALTFTLKKIDIIASINSTSKTIMIEKVETLEDAYNYFKSGKDPQFNNLYQWDDVEIVEWVNGSSSSYPEWYSGYYVIKVKKDSFYYKNGGQSKLYLRRKY